MPAHEREGFRVVDLLVIRPSQDLGRLAGDYEAQLSRAFRFLTRGWGTRETSSPDLLSLLMFEAAYLRRLIEIGEADADARFGHALLRARRYRPQPPRPDPVSPSGLD